MVLSISKRWPQWLSQKMEPFKGLYKMVCYILRMPTHQLWNGDKIYFQFSYKHEMPRHFPRVVKFITGHDSKALV
uniref:Uncharacterized protein n=1 Tax=Octopus bimaculoides TaxID=37653 RepID=A0A0L8HGX5_OCTBM